MLRGWNMLVKINTCTELKPGTIRKESGAYRGECCSDNDRNCLTEKRLKNYVLSESDWRKNQEAKNNVSKRVLSRGALSGPICNSGNRQRTGCWAITQMGPASHEPWTRREASSDWCQSIHHPMRINPINLISAWNVILWVTILTEECPTSCLPRQSPLFG